MGGDLTDDDDQLVEELDSQGRATGVEADDGVLGPDSDAIHDPFDPDKIDVVTRTPTIELLLSRLRNGRLDLQPDFQRSAGIWGPKRRSRLIESLLLRIPLPTLYAAEGPSEEWSVVDGVQRMTAIASFVKPEAVGDRSVFRLTDLEYLKNCEGMTFAELPGRLQERIQETELIVHLIRKGTPEAVKFNIFARINTGGLPLSAQELRHALIPGQARSFIKELAELPEFKLATTNSVRSDRMVDREMALRFVAFRLTPPTQYNAGDMDRFLRATMHTVNTLTDRQLAGLHDEFQNALRAAKSVLGKHAFRKRDPKRPARRLPVNKALFEAVSVNLATRPQATVQLASRADMVGDRFIDLMTDPEFMVAISQGTGDVAKVRHRFSVLAQLFDEVSA